MTRLFLSVSYISSGIINSVAWGCVLVVKIDLIKHCRRFTKDRDRFDKKMFEVFPHVCLEKITPPPVGHVFRWAKAI